MSGLYLGKGNEKEPIQLGVITEFLKTTLHQAIRKDARLSKPKMQLHIAKQMASGMSFLHSLNPCILVRF